MSFETEWPTSVAFWGSGRRVAAGNRLGQIFVWELPENPPEPDPKEKDKKQIEAPNVEPVRQLIGHTNGITHLRATPDGKTLISASLDHTVRLWDVDKTPNGKAELILDQKTRDRDSKYGSQESKDKILDAPPVHVETVDTTHVLKRHGDWVNGLRYQR